MSFFDDDDGVLRENGGRGTSHRRVRWLFGFFVLIAIGGYAALHLYSADRVPLGVSVEGVSIGGMNENDAVARLAQRLGPDLSRPIRFTSSDHDYPFDVAAAGVTIDFRGTVAATGATASRWSPASLWHFLTDGGDRDAVVRVDRSSFDAALLKLTGQIGRPAIEGTISFRDGKASPVYGRSGLAIDADATAGMVPKLIFSHDAVELPMTVRRPYVSPAQVRKALHDFGDPAMSAPVRVVIGGHSFEVSPRVFGPAIQMVPSNGGLVPLIDPNTLVKVLAPALPTIGPKPVDATLALSNGRPRVVPAVIGAAYDAGALRDAFVAALTKKASARVASVHAALTAPTVSTAAARGWQVSRKVASVTAKVDGGLAARLDGAVVTPRSGLHLATVLGTTNAGVGSAIFQLALKSSMNIDSFSPTAAYRADLPVGLAAKDVELSAPKGRAWLITVERVGTQQARFTAWSAKGLHAKVTVGPQTDPVPPGTGVSSSPECTPRTGQAGFSVSVARTGPGTPSTFDSTYLPINTVQCLPPSATPSP